MSRCYPRITLRNEIMDTNKDVFAVNNAVNAIKFGTTNSTSTNTGALVLAGGLGIAKNAYVGGNVDIKSTATGALIVEGGASVAKNVTIVNGNGGFLYTGTYSGTQSYTSTTTGVLIGRVGQMTFTNVTMPAATSAPIIFSVSNSMLTSGSLVIPSIQAEADTTFSVARGFVPYLVSSENTTAGLLTVAVGNIGTATAASTTPGKIVVSWISPAQTTVS